MDILAAGIDVLTSLNVQHIESLNDQVWHVTGIRVRETVPDWVVQEADEVVMVDVTTRALLHRLERGVVYTPDKAKRALENFFTESNLTALRELAMRQTAHQIEERLEEPVREPLPVGAGVPAGSHGRRYCSGSHPIPRRRCWCGVAIASPIICMPHVSRSPSDAIRSSAVPLLPPPTWRWTEAPDVRP